jgi:hypothetical protein
MGFVAYLDKPINPQAMGSRHPGSRRRRTVSAESTSFQVDVAEKLVSYQLAAITYGYMGRTNEWTP